MDRCRRRDRVPLGAPPTSSSNPECSHAYARAVARALSARRPTTTSGWLQADRPIRGEILFTARDAENLDQIWKIDQDGKPPLQVTATEKGASLPSLAPDGTWFVYSLETRVGSGGLDWAVGKQQTGGGDPVLLATNASPAAISPDGKHVAIRYFRPNDHGDAHVFLEVIPAEGGAPVISIDVKETIGGQRWRPDGQALTCRDFLDDQVWLQPLDGGQPQQLTHFDHGRTVSHAWSPDGKWLYLAREEVTRDAVLIRDFQ